MRVRVVRGDKGTDNGWLGAKERERDTGREVGGLDTHTFQRYHSPTPPPPSTTTPNPQTLSLSEKLRARVSPARPASFCLFAETLSETRTSWAVAECLRLLLSVVGCLRELSRPRGVRRRASTSTPRLALSEGLRDSSSWTERRWWLRVSSEGAVVSAEGVQSSRGRRLWVFVATGAGFVGGDWCRLWVQDSLRGLEKRPVVAVGIYVLQRVSVDRRNGARTFAVFVGALQVGVDTQTSTATYRRAARQLGSRADRLVGAETSRREIGKQFFVGGIWLPSFGRFLLCTARLRTQTPRLVVGRSFEDFGIWTGSVAGD